MQQELGGVKGAQEGVKCSGPFTLAEREFDHRFEYDIAKEDKSGSVGAALGRGYVLERSSKQRARPRGQIKRNTPSRT